MFKLYLYGIEIEQGAEGEELDEGFKLYLYGIEINLLDWWTNYPAGSNCTFMELKLGTEMNAANWEGLFKLYLYGIEIGEGVPRERLAMAFKLYLYGIEITRTTDTTKKWRVQIVPLWNWNDRGGDPEEFKAMSSNCTFMELKFTRKRAKPGKIWVQIVPLWNWNSHI